MYMPIGRVLGTAVAAAAVMYGILPHEECQLLLCVLQVVSRAYVDAVMFRSTRPPRSLGPAAVPAHLCPSVHRVEMGGYHCLQSLEALSSSSVSRLRSTLKLAKKTGRTVLASEYGGLVSSLVTGPRRASSLSDLIVTSENTTAALEKFLVNGVVIFPNLLSPLTTRELRLRTLEYRNVSRSKQRLGEDTFASGARSRLNFAVPLSRRGEPFLDALANVVRSLSPLLISLVGREAELLQSSALVSLAGASMQLPHTDVCNNDRVSNRTLHISLYIPLVDVGLADGALLVVPGSHRLSSSDVGVGKPGDLNCSGTEAVYAPETATLLGAFAQWLLALPLTQGSVAVYARHMIHAAGPHAPGPFGIRERPVLQFNLMSQLHEGSWRADPSRNLLHVIEDEDARQWSLAKLLAHTRDSPSQAQRPGLQ